jgi:hypothetical protein
VMEGKLRLGGVHRSLQPGGQSDWLTK